MDFPHMKETAFPDLESVDVYKYQNEFDYSRYDEMQMHLQLCSVPWDMGEAHIGARTISGIGNVVWFETEEKRNKWFDSIPDSECYRFDTKYKALHRDNEIIVPVPFEVASLYNYLAVTYEPFASAGDYVQYETGNGLNHWYWFIREVEFLAPNSTRLILMNDAWQTFIYRMHFAGMILERGHAPMFETSATKYLSNPLANASGLLAEDINYGGEPSIVANTAGHVFNDENWACIACTSSPTSSWGSKGNNDWHTPALSSYTVDGVPNMRIFCMEVGELNSFLGAVDAQAPQFKSTVKGVFFAPKELITTGATFTFCDTECHWVSTSNKTIDLVNLNKAFFGYPAKYANIAKLYTWPYAAIEITDENGNSNLIKIEDTTGALDISASLSLAYPAISLQAHILGAGGNSRNSLAFANITSRSLTIGGKWYETLHSWNVPVFGIVQSSSVHNDYDTHFDRVQQAIAYNNAYDSAIASADAAKANAYASADTALTNATNSANTLTSNASAQTAANTAITNAGNTCATNISSHAINTNNANTDNANALTNASTNNQIDYQYATGAISAVSSVVNSAASGAMSGGAAGLGFGLVGGLISAGTAMANCEAAVNLSEAQAGATTAANDNNCLTSNWQTLNDNISAGAAAIQKNTATNNLITTTASNNAATQITNATNDNATQKANADRSYAAETGNAARTRNTASNAVTNQIKQAALGRPFEFGEFRDNGQATTKPMALLANAVTQAPAAVEMNGDEFLRYGYTYNKQWKFSGNWCIGKYFTYWKLADFWVRGLNIPDMYVDKLRFFLYGGVTIWRKPEDIGNVTIYENDV